MGERLNGIQEVDGSIPFSSTTRFVHRLVALDEVDSTMVVAKKLATQHIPAPHGTSVTARLQTAGRGRHGRRWHAPRDAGLWLTTLLRPEAPVARLPGLAVVAAAATYLALRRLLPAATPLRLKWPNDLLVRGRKLAGILLEVGGLQPGACPYVLVGIGINVCARALLADLPQDLHDKTVACGDLIDGALPEAFISELTYAVLDALQAQVGLWRVDGLTAALRVWEGADALRGQTVRIATAGATVAGRACGLAADGSLQVRTGDSITCVGSGEVHVLPAT